MSLRTKPFKKNQYGYPTHELDGKVGYPVDHAVEGEHTKTNPGHPAPEGGAPDQYPGKPGAGSTPGMGKGARS